MRFNFCLHLNKISAICFVSLLGFRRALPTTGRTLNAVTQIMQIANKELIKTFFISPEPDSNVCFTGNCEQYCDYFHPICAKGNHLEVNKILNFTYIIRITTNLFSRDRSWLFFLLMTWHCEKYAFPSINWLWTKTLNNSMKKYSIPPK